MPEVGDIVRGRKVGLTSGGKYIWQACIYCGKERWILCDKKEAISLRCRFCNRGQLNGNWKGGIRIHPMGYIMIWMPNHPDAYSNGYVSRARLVLEKKLGRPLIDGAIPHHRGIKYPVGNIENKQDDRPENLEELLTLEHYKFHANGRARDERGRFTACRI